MQITKDMTIMEVLTLMQEKEHYRLLYEEQERGGNAYAE